MDEIKKDKLIDNNDSVNSNDDSSDNNVRADSDRADNNDSLAGNGNSPAADNVDNNADSPEKADAPADNQNTENTEASSEQEADKPFSLDIDLENTFDKYPDELQSAQSGKPGRKKKKKKNKSFLKAIIYVSIVIFFSLLLTFVLLIGANDMFGLVKPDIDAEINIEKGSSLKTISKQLKDNDIISQPMFFRLYCRSKKGEVEKFQYGLHNFNATMSYDEIIIELSRPAKKLDTVTVTIREGEEISKIAQILEKNGVCSSQKFLTAVNYSKIDHPILNTIRDEDKLYYRLEGYLFPDTYEFYLDENPDSVIKRFLNNLDLKLTTDLRQRMEELNMTIDETLALASIIQKEAARYEDMVIVSSVFHNRLKSKEFPRLESCATIFYIKKESDPILLEQDKYLNSPFNTYQYTGLTPGAICSPGLDAIKAALYPEQTDYLFFVTDVNGKFYFSKKLNEHYNNVNKARRIGKVTGGTTTID